MRVWTVGNPNTYDVYLAKGSNIYKGVGGWLWETLEQAEDFLFECNGEWTWDDKTVPLVPYPVEIKRPFSEVVGDKDSNGVYLVKLHKGALIKPRGKGD